MSDDRREIIRFAEQLYGQNPDWVSFFREVLGVEGLVHRLYPTPEVRAAFEQTDEYQQIQLMLAKLREKGTDSSSSDYTSSGDESEPTRVITVRLPKSLHESLRVEAHGRHTSLNKLCISVLLERMGGHLSRAPIVKENEPVRAVTVRVPKSLHESLRFEARELKTSIADLGVYKLNHWLAPKLVANVASPLSLYFDLNEFSSRDIAELLSALSDLYRSIGGDALKIDGLYTVDPADLPAPVGA